MIDMIKREKLEDLWMENYGEVFTDFFFDKYLDEYGCKYYTNGNDVIANVSYRPSEYVVNGKILRCSYILNPIVHKNYSFDYVKRLLEEVVDELSQHEIISLIGTDNQKLYEELGFETIYKKKTYLLTKYNVPTLNKYEVSFSASDIDMLKCYGKFSSYFNGYKLRNDNDFKELKAYKISLGYNYIYNFDNEELKAYASYIVKDGVAVIDEIIYLDSLSFASIISSLLDDYGAIELSISAAENIDFLARNLQYKESDFIMARINDYKAFNSLFNSNVSTTLQGYLLSRKHPYSNEIY